MMTLSPEAIRRLQGFGMFAEADGYVFRPTTVDEIREILELARQTGRKIVLRGAGRSYGDAAIAPEALALDISRMSRVLVWDKSTGLLTAEAGVTIEQLWRTVLEDGYWPPVVSGTMYPTLAGALAMNIHGKNAYRVGPIGDSVQQIGVLFPNGEHRRIDSDDPLFASVVSSAGLLGIITEVTLKMKKIGSGDLRVLPVSCRNWEHQIEVFESLENDADYMVSWIDCFASGKRSGRGVFHAGWYAEGGAGMASTLDQRHQDLPDTILGFFPKSVVWRFLKVLNNRVGMRLVNAAKHHSARILGNGKPHPQSLVGFSFLLDYVPHWRQAYLPDGFIQYQSFVPRAEAIGVFRRQIELQHRAGIVSFLGVLKLHRPDRYLFSHGVDGYSFALDFKVSRKNWPKLQALCHQMNDLVLDAGGRFYLAKDYTLRPTDVRRYLGEETLSEFRRLKAELDPDNLLTSSLARRVGLI